MLNSDYPKLLKYFHGEGERLKKNCYNYLISRKKIKNNLFIYNLLLIS